MKFLICNLVFVIFSGVLHGKESMVTLNAFKAYNRNDTETPAVDLPPKIALSNLLKKENIFSEIEQTLATLQCVRLAPSADSIPELKELWKLHHKNTFRSRDPVNWYYIRSLDSNQLICNEIKKLIEKFGGNINDLEPREEKNTFALNDTRTSLNELIKNPENEAWPSQKFNETIKNLFEIAKTIDLGASTQDHILQGFYLTNIVTALDNEKVWPDRYKVELTNPIINLYDELLTNSLSKIDSKWTPRLSDKTPDDDKKEEKEPSAEQMMAWSKESLKGYQQMNLPKLRDQILANVAGIIAARKGDEDFKQGLLKRFSKNEECAKTIKARLDTLK